MPSLSQVGRILRHVDRAQEDRVREIAREEIAIAERITLLEIAVRELRDEVREYRRDHRTLEAAMMNQFEAIGERFDGVEGHLDGVEGHLEGVEGRLEGVEGRLERLKSDVKAGFEAVLDRL